MEDLSDREREAGLADACWPSQGQQADVGPPKQLNGQAQVATPPDQVTRRDRRSRYRQCGIRLRHSTEWPGPCPQIVGMVRYHGFQARHGMDGDQNRNACGVLEQ